MDLGVPFAFSVGLLSSVHCIGMCGGISAALALGHLPPEGRSVRATSRILLLANLGRIFTYTLAGALAGMVGAGTGWLLGPSWGHGVLRVLGSAVLISVGCYLGGWLPQFSRLDRLGERVWVHLRRWRREVLPIRNALQAFGYGVVWGGLPCALVYSALTWAASSGTPTAGAMRMASFGLATLPGVWFSGMFAGVATGLWRHTVARRYAGALLILMGLAAAWIEPHLALHARHITTPFSPH